MAKVATDDKHYKAIADTIREFYGIPDDVYRPSDMANGVRLVADEQYGKGETAGYNFGYQMGNEDGFSEGYQEGHDEGFTVGEQSGLADCAAQHFVHNFIGDGGTSYSFHVPFEPDFIQIFCFDPTVINKASVLASFFYDRRAFGLYAGTYQYGSGSGSLKNGAFSTTSASTRYVRAEDGTITVKDFTSSAVIVYGAGLPYTIVAVKYAEQSDKERITAFVNGLTGGGSVTLNQAKVNAAFTTDEWAELIGTKPNWTFNLV